MTDKTVSDTKSSETESTFYAVNYGVIVRCDLDKIPLIKRAISNLSWRIYYDTFSPRDELLWIVKKERTQ